ncbi:MAG: hypothetical protein ACLTW9_23770 [Enterocloster sp.]
MKTGKSFAAASLDALWSSWSSCCFLFLAPFGIVFFNSLKPSNEILLDPRTCRTSCTLRISPGMDYLKCPQSPGSTVLHHSRNPVFFLVFLTAMSSYWISRHHDAWSG